MVYYGYVYIWYDVIRKKFCIGSHYGQVEDAYISSTGHFVKAYKKRPDTFKFRVLDYIFEDDKKLLLEKENRWLQMIKSEELGVRYYNLKNVAAGGDTFSNLSDEKKQHFRKKCGLASRKYWDNISSEELIIRKKNAFGGNPYTWRGKKLTEEHKNKISLSVKGEKNGFFGKTHSKETKQKISESKRGIERGPHSEATKNKIRIGNTGKKHSEETKLKLSEKSKNNQSHSKMWKITKVSGEIITVRNLSKFCRENEINPNSIRQWKNLKKPYFDLLELEQL